MSWIPPAAVDTVDIAWLALRAAKLSQAICDCSFCAMPRPAASSLARLMRKAEDRRWTGLVKWVCEMARLCWATKETLWVRMTDGVD